MPFKMDSVPGPQAETTKIRRQSVARFLGASARIVLETTSDLTETLGHSLGQQKLVALLQGTDSAFVRASELTMVPHYGIFQLFRKAWVIRLVEILRESGYLQAAGELRPVLELSEEATELLRNSEELPALPQEALRDPVIGAVYPLSGLEVKLRQLRMRLAGLLRRPPRQVMSDPLIRSLCQDKPQDQEEVELRLPKSAKPYAGEVWTVLEKK